MQEMSLDLLTRASSPGGPSCLSSVTELRPAGGPQSAVAPAKFVSADSRSPGSVYAYERRYLDGVLRHTALIDSKQSQLNRVESALALALEAEDGVLARLPHIRVTYPDGEAYTDLSLPHRAFDGHIRAGSVGGIAVTATDAYRAVRNSTPLDARPLLETSPVTLVFGGWDASRKARQGRWRSALVGEIVGFLAGESNGNRPPTAHKGGARVDPVGMSVQLDGTAMREVLAGQRPELSAKTIATIEKAAANKTQPQSAAALGLGGIPPSLGDLAGVACDRIIRSHVLSFATLRQMRFGAGVDGDAACRALLAALALNGLARSDAELCLRANCDLIEAAPTRVELDQRGGALLDVMPLPIDAADALLAAALARAEELAGISWHGLVLDVTGNPAVVRGAIDDSDA